MKYLSRKEAADRLTKQGFKTSKSTLAKLACLGGGPDYHKFGIRALYTADDLDAWATRKLSPAYTSTSDLDTRADKITSEPVHSPSELKTEDA
jgi:hypothetical protein